MTAKGPNVLIPSKEKARLAKQWQNALIVKLLVRMIDPEYLERKVQQLWACDGDAETIDVGSGFFVVQFTDAVRDYDLALIGGPWLIFDHYLAVQPQETDFKPMTEKISRIAAWIRLTNLPLDYYDKGILCVRIADSKGVDDGYDYST
ncbi:hypothetical protein K1719_027616 [Acacia pycnantha]|nr:hypothetical protein K1719_027616 [Acacia pycnantha]